ncbi:MAG: HAD-IA family hydrolase [Nitrospirae bacterium]|nr:HAD-IA family hydrolase [Nitrospirota bacterium]
MRPKEPTSSITTLFLDIGGVLLNNGWDRTIRRRAAETFGLDYDEMDERHHLTYSTYEEGKLSLYEYLYQVVFYKERSFTRDDFTAFMFGQSQPFTEMIEFIRKLKERYHLKVAAISNEGRELAIYRINKFELGSIIDVFVSSCFVHFRKPDVDIYRMALDIARVSPSKTVYIDDRAIFVEVAESLDIHSVHHTGYESTRAAMRAFDLVLP